MKKIIPVLLIVAAVSGCNPLSDKEASLKAINPLLDIKIPCKSAQWDAVTTVEEGRKITEVKSKILYRAGKFRIEIMSPGNEYSQVILLDEKNLYVIGQDNTAYMYGTDMREAEVFLRRVFVNTGLSRKPEIKLADADYKGRKCSVYEYEILRNVNGLYAKTKVREWRDKKGNTVKMQGQVGPAEFFLGGRRLVVGPLKETYETSNYTCNVNLLGILFTVPMGMKILDYSEEYANKMKQFGKQAPANSGRVTMTVKKSK